MISFYRLSIQEVLKANRSRLTGLTEKEVIKRQHQIGKNTYKYKNPKSNITLLLTQLKDFTILTLIVAFTLTWFYEKYILAFSIIFIIILNSVFGYIQARKSRNNMKLLHKRNLFRAKVLRENVHKRVKFPEIVVGDIVLLEKGDIIPADIRIIESNGLVTDESSILGDMDIKQKISSPIDVDNLPVEERHNMLLANTIVLEGKGKGVVVGIGDFTYFGQISSKVNNPNINYTPIQRQLLDFGKDISLFSIIVTFIYFTVSIFTKHCCYFDLFLTSMALLVAAVPEALPAVTSITLGIVTKHVTKDFVINDFNSVEILGEVEFLLVDLNMFEDATNNKNFIDKMSNSKTYCIFYSEKPKEFLITQMFKHFSRLENDNILDGKELESLSLLELESSLQNLKGIYNASNDLILKLLDTMKIKNHKVAVLCHDLDNIKLVRSVDFGIAYKANSTQAIRSISKMTLLKTNVMKIFDAILESRKILLNIEKFLAYSITGNFSLIITFFLALFLELPNPLMAIQILWINLWLDSLPGLALATEQSDPYVIGHKRIIHKDVIFSQVKWEQLVSYSVIIGIIAILFEVIAIKVFPDNWQTLMFVFLYLVRPVTGYSLRFENQKILGDFKKTFSNKNYNIAVFTVIAILLGVVFIPKIGFIFGTDPISWWEFLIPGVLTILIFALFEYLKPKFIKD